MVNYLATSLFLLKSTWAGRQQIEDVLSAMAANIASNDDDQEPLRGLAIPGFGNFMDGYGCWGYFDGVGKPKGKTQDELDNISKSMQQNYECLMIATENGDLDACVDKPWDVQYTVSGSMYAHLFTGDMPKVLTECETSNQSNKCAENVCKVEMGISAKLMAEFQAGGYNQNNEHLSGFDPIAECVPKVGVPGERYCCGVDYPEKFVYKNPAGLNRECCVDHTFDANVLECCADGSSKAAGTC